MSIEAAINQVLQNPQYHDLLGILKGARNGAVYGAKLRFSHALVMSVLFRSGSLKSRWDGIVKNTKQHARALATFVFIYKLVLYALKQLRSSKVSALDEIKARTNGMDAFVGGLVGGYFVFGRNSKSAALSTINQQMVLYVFSRVVLGMGKKLMERMRVKDQNQVANWSWTVLSSLSWALVMMLFRTDKEVLQRSMLHSMNYLYIDSEQWTNLWDFI